MGPIKPKSFWTAEFFFFNVVLLQLGFPGGSVVKNLPANAEDVDLTPMLGRSPGEGNSNPLQILVWEVHGQSSLVGYSPWGHKTVRHDLVTKQQQQHVIITSKCLLN